MSADPDEEALTWDATDDPTHSTDSVQKPKRVSTRGSRPAGTALEQPATSDEDAAVAPATGSFLLVTYGIIAGACLLYVVGWVLGLGHVNSTGDGALVRVMGLISQGLAIAAPVLWFGGTFLITRKRKPLVRLLLLIAGLVVTLPIPFILLGAAR